MEEIAGWVLYHQDKTKESVAHLRKATSLLPENSIWWRSALWRLGAALEASGEEQEALTSYLRSYDKNAPDEGRRTIIEKLYRKLNGSLEGLEAKLGTNSSASTGNLQTPAPTGVEKTATEPATTEAAKNEPVSKSDETPAPQSTDALPATGEGGSQQANTDKTAGRPTETESQPASAPTPATSEQPPAAATRGRTTGKQAAGGCSFSIDVDTITIKSNGGTGHITVSLSGSDKITPTTSDWPDITVFAQSLKEYGTFPFLITSISKRTGRYTVTFTTPCGSKDVTVIVK
jgi:hypothetical protein